MEMSWQLIITIVMFMVVHLSATVWFLSKLNTTVYLKFDALTKSVDVMSKAIANAYSKDDALREIGRVEAIANKAHSRLDNHFTEHNHQKVD